METKFFNSRETCFRAKAELTVRSPRRFARTTVAEEPAGFGVRARQRRFPRASDKCRRIKHFCLPPRGKRLSAESLMIFEVQP